MRLFLLLLIFSLIPQQALFAQLNVSITPEISTSSFLIPLQLSLSEAEFNFAQRTSVLHLNHPQNRFFIQSYNRADITMVTEISNFSYMGEAISLKVGRDYIVSGPSQINGPLFSSFAPSLDHFAFHFFRSHNVDFEYRLIRLDNRQHLLGTFNRWMYYRRISLQLAERFELGFKDIVLATGVQRGIDLNYLNPAAIFQLEQLHGHVEAGTPGQNNDNQLMGFDISWSVSPNLQIYGDFILDEFQIDIADREHIQDVFGLTIGLEKNYPGSELVLEYYLASPWLYTNGGMFTNVEIQGIPLGYRAPQSHGVSVMYQHQLVWGQMMLQMSSCQIGEQTVLTDWDSVGNRIPLYDFDHNWQSEFDLSFYFEHNKYIDHIRLTYDLLDSEGLYFVVGFNLFTYNSGK